MSAQPPFDEVTAVDLVVRYQSGQEGALADLYRFLEPAIRTGLRRYRSADLPTSLTRQDISQQCWVILADLARRWRPRGSFLAYFFRTFPYALQRFVHRPRPRRRTVEIMVPHDEVMLAADRVREAEPIWETKPTWQEVLAGLSAPERQVFVLHSVEGQSFASISQALGVSRATAYRLHRRALAQLSNQIGAERSAERSRESIPEVPAGAGPSMDPTGHTPHSAGASPEAAIIRLVHALHAGAGPSGELGGRTRTLLTTGLNRRDYAELMARLEGLGIVVNRGPRRSGSLAYRAPEESLHHLLVPAGDDRWLRLSPPL